VVAGRGRVTAHTASLALFCPATCWAAVRDKKGRRLATLTPTIAPLRPPGGSVPARLEVERDTFEPVVKTEEVGETHATMHLRRKASHLAADVTQMRLGLQRSNARLLG
jgi:hypothetical protein